MSSDIDRPQDDDQLPPEKTWRVGRPWAGVLFVLLAAANLVIVVIDLTDGDGATTGDQARTWLRLAIVVSFLALAVGELRRRVAVDADGVHLIETFRRRTYPWRDISEVRMGRPTAFSGSFVYLLRHETKHVELPGSGGNLRLLQRWHEATATV